MKDKKNCMPLPRLLRYLKQKGDTMLVVASSHQVIHNTWNRLKERKEVTGSIRITKNLVVNPKNMDTIKCFFVSRI